MGKGNLKPFIAQQCTSKAQKSGHHTKLMNFFVIALLGLTLEIVLKNKTVQKKVS
jgi:hypothetical protein